MLGRDRDPAAVAGMPACDLPIDVVDPDLGQGHSAAIQAIKEAVDGTQAAANRRAVGS